MIHKKTSDGVEYWYNTNGDEIHFKVSAGYESWTEYDSNGNKIHHKDNDGFEYWREYDANGNMIHEWGGLGNEWFSEDYKEIKVC